MVMSQIQKKIEVPKSASLVPQSELRCQCSSTCKNPVKRGETFCDKHVSFCPVKGHLTGWEPKYNPDLYNNDKSIQHSHNCFAYSMDVKDLKRIQSCREKKDCHFHVPGKTKGHPEFTGQMGKTCGDVIGRTMADVPTAYLTDFQRACEPGFSQIGVVVDEKNDLHYYRQDSNGWWSHKPGGREVTNVDAVGASIYRPDLASRNYPAESPGDTGLNYNSFCSYMCVPRASPENNSDPNNSDSNSDPNNSDPNNSDPNNPNNPNNNPIQIAGAKKRKYKTRRAI